MGSERVEAVAKIKTLKNKLWNLTSEYVRRKDADENGYVACYTCGKVKHWKTGDAGHAIPGRHNKVLYDLELLRFQCKHCNGAKSGQQYIFGRKLNEENGEGWFELKQIESHENIKYYLSDYEEMIEAMEGMVKSL